MRDFTSTVALASTVPMVFTVTGTLRRTATATRTGAGPLSRLRFGAGRPREQPEQDEPDRRDHDEPD